MPHPYYSDGIDDQRIAWLDEINEGAREALALIVQRPAGRVLPTTQPTTS